MAYLTDGDAHLRGRLPHPTIPLRPSDQADRDTLSRLEGVFTITPQEEAGVFPTSRHAARIAAPLGPRATGPTFGSPLAAHADTAWWNTAADGGCIPHDDEAECALQEQVHHVFHPDICREL